MSEYRDVFHAANDFNFGAIKVMIMSQQASINSLDEYGSPILTAYLYSYYRWLYDSIEYSENDIVAENYDDAGVYNEPGDLFLPLNQRQYDIKSDIDWFIKEGIHINTHSTEQGNSSLILFEAVQECDYYLSEYLLSLGADPNGCYGIQSSYHIGNYFLEHADSIFWDIPRSSKIHEMLPRFRKLLLRYGAKENIMPDA